MHERLRGAGRWIWFGLAGVFALSFVALGVGNAGGLGFQDLFNGGGSSSTHSAATPVSPALASAIAATHASPTNPAVWQTLGAAYTTRAGADNDPASAQADYQAAIQAYTHARTLAPTSPPVLRGVADAYTALAGFAAQQAQTLQNASSTTSPLASTFIPGGAANEDAFSRADAAASLQQQQNQNSQLGSLQSTELLAISQAKQITLTLTRLTPSDPTAWFNLGQTAQQSGDTRTAITAYQRFLGLVPGDPLAPQVRQAVTALQASIAKPKPKPVRTNPANPHHASTSSKPGK
jgi:cytochrome c-type biogenesis protein CcmH/NrfG